MERLDTETPERCREIVEGRPVLVKSADPPLLADTLGVRLQRPPATSAGPTVA